jgi:hypothetical protein
LNGRIGRLAFRQQRPWDYRARVVLAGRRGPTRRKQRRIRERTFEPHAIERRLRKLELLVLDEQRTEHEVGLVPDREHGFVAAFDSARAIELLERVLATPVFKQRDAVVVLGKPGERLGTL